MRRLVPVLLAALCACHPEPAPQPPRAGEYPGELVSTADMGAGFLMRQRVTATYADKDTSFEAVLQFKEGTLTMLALTPFGTKAFVLTQTGTEVAFEKFVERELPFPPDYILLDIHRALFMGAGAPPTDGEHARERAGERISESWAGGRLQRRIFARIDGVPAGEIVVRFPDGHVPETLPTVMHLDNGWFGYSLEIKTLSGRMLP
jgi:hypothetical protein